MGNANFRSLSQDAPPVKVIYTLAAVALVSSDSDLLDAAISELANISPQRVILEDPESHVPLVLSTHALIDDKPEDAVRAYETALQFVPTDWKTRNRLARLLLDDEKYEEAVDLLNVETGPGVAASVKAEMAKLKGSARILLDDRRGLSGLMAAVKLCPWDEKCWKGLEWGRQAAEGLPEPEVEAEVRPSEVAAE